MLCNGDLFHLKIFRSSHRDGGSHRLNVLATADCRITLPILLLNGDKLEDENAIDAAISWLESEPWL